MVVLLQSSVGITCHCTARADYLREMMVKYEQESSFTFQLTWNS